jgi:hypothetical protein
MLLWLDNMTDKGRDITGLDVMAEIFAFLAGLFFTGILLWIGQRGSIPDLIISIKDYTLNITNLAPFFLTLTFVLFAFASLSYAFSLYHSTDDFKYSARLQDRGENLAMTGTISMFATLFVILCLISLLIAIIGVGLSIAVLLYLARE